MLFIINLEQNCLYLNKFLFRIQQHLRESDIGSYGYRYHYGKHLPISNRLTFIVADLRLALCKQISLIVLVGAWILNMVANFLILKPILIWPIQLKPISLSKQRVQLVHLYLIYCSQSKIR